MTQESLVKLAAGIPAKRLGQPEEIAQAALSIFENDRINPKILSPRRLS